MREPSSLARKNFGRRAAQRFAALFPPRRKTSTLASSLFRRNFSVFAFSLPSRVRVAIIENIEARRRVRRSEGRTARPRDRETALRVLESLRRGESIRQLSESSRPGTFSRSTRHSAFSRNSGSHGEITRNSLTRKSEPDFQSSGEAGRTNDGKLPSAITRFRRPVTKPALFDSDRAARGTPRGTPRVSEPKLSVFRGDYYRARYRPTFSSFLYPS